MDGNGRWAEAQGLPRLDGHQRGADTVRQITRVARSMGLKRLTLYAFSRQNWQRPVEEVQGLMALLREYLLSERAEVLDNGVRLTTIGDTRRLPRSVTDPLDELIDASKDNLGMVLCLALNYGAREEIVSAAQRLCQRVLDGTLSPELVSEEMFSRALGGTDPDLIIRTSGEQRLSNFLLWESAYSEFYFTEVSWPEFTVENFKAAIHAYSQRDRRFGGAGKADLL
jgi:undecaprenyl diphosphate synthase